MQQFVRKSCNSAAGVGSSSQSDTYTATDMYPQCQMKERTTNMARHGVCAACHRSNAGVICPISIVPKRGESYRRSYYSAASGGVFFPFSIILSAGFPVLTCRIALLRYCVNASLRQCVTIRYRGSRKTFFIHGRMTAGFKSRLVFDSCCKTAGRIGRFAARLPLVLRPIKNRRVLLLG